MKVFEFEAKKILTNYGINTPGEFCVIKKDENFSKTIQIPAVAKVQISQGKRGKRGGIKIVKSKNELQQFLTEAFEKDFNNEKPKAVLVEEEIKGTQEIYISISYNKKGPILTINKFGGVEVEGQSSESVIFPIDIITQKILTDKNKIKSILNLSNNVDIEGFIEKIINCFFKEDCQLLEINPLTITQNGNLVALDAKMILDDRAGFRHKERLLEMSKESENQNLSKSEKAIKELNNILEFRGSPCRYIELMGDVALLLSGGGASVIVLDYLVDAGVIPGNYSEYSGNPKREKLEALTKVILEKPNQRGLLIAGGIANFTLIDETMAGIADALSKIQPKYPIIIRRGGPGEEKGKEIMLNLAKKYNLNITWLDSKNSLKDACNYFIKALN